MGLDSMSPIPSSWSFYLQKALYSMNTQVSDAHGFQPAYLYSGHLTDPITGPNIDENSPYACHLRLAKSILNFSKLNRSSNYKFRVLKKGQNVIVRYDHQHTGSPIKGVII